MPHGLPYIANRKLYKAVSFSLAMQRDGLHPDIADKTAGEYYRFARETVARYTEAAPPWMRGRGDPPDPF